jgi:hypothetical protein
MCTSYAYRVVPKDWLPRSHWCVAGIVCLLRWSQCLLTILTIAVPDGVKHCMCGPLINTGEQFWIPSAGLHTRVND